MSSPANILQQVQTYQNHIVAWIENMNCFVANANTKFERFNETVINNLGATVTWTRQPRYTFQPGLVVDFQATTQLVQSLTIDQSGNVGIAFNSPEMIFNVEPEDFIKQFAHSALIEATTNIEAQVAENVCTNSNVYRFYTTGGDTTPAAINSYQQLAQALTQFRNFGAAMDTTKVFISDLIQYAVVGSGLSQFVLPRNEESYKVWELGDYSRASFYVSNMLPIWTSGLAGNNGETLTFVSINAAGTQITFHTDGSAETQCLKQGDLLQFASPADNPLTFRTYVGHRICANPVQCVITADADSTGLGPVTVVADVYPALLSAAGPNQNLSRALTTSDTATVVPNHKRGLIYSADAMYLGMPRLPDQYPYPTGNEADPDTGVSMRLTQGVKVFENQLGLALDCIWGSTIIPENAMLLVFPLTQ